MPIVRVPASRSMTLRVLWFRPVLWMGTGDDKRRWCEGGHRSPNKSMPQSTTLWGGLLATTCIDLTRHVATTEQNRLLYQSGPSVANSLNQMLQMPAPVKILDQVHDDRYLAPTADHLQTHGQVDAFIVQ